MSKTTIRCSTVLCAVVLGLSACATPSATSVPSASPAPTPESSASPSASASAELTIRDVDFSVVEWREAVNQFVLTPAEPDDLWTLEVDPEIAYADVNGDGHEDALVGLTITDQQWFEQVWYIWTWDSEGETPVQVESPVARMARCGDTVLSVDATEDAFVITEALRYQDADGPDCATPGPVEVTRHVTLENNWPVLTGGLQGDGGICPQLLGNDVMWPVEDFELRVGPWESMSLLSEPPPASFGEADVWSRLWLYRENWMLVHVGFMNPTDGPPVTGGEYTPCAWIYLEQDTRPIPHDVYLPEE